MSASLRPFRLVSLAGLVVLASALGASCGSDETGGSGSGSGSGGSGETLCGNGFPDPDLGEECDDGNLDDSDGCTSQCLLPRCGDGFVQAGVEECDDANLDDGDACLSTCKANVCGDGFVNVGVEACDDANDEQDDACTSQCTPGVGCGNGLLDAGEECDDGNTNNADACLATCKVAFCGDGYAQVGVEECDDANANDADNCTNACKLNENANFGCPGIGLVLDADSEASVTGDTSKGKDEHQGSCGTGSAPEVIYAFTAPVSGTLDIAVSGQGPASDPVLYVRSGSCTSGTELACADNTFGGGTEQTVLAAEAGTDYFVFIDGYDQTAGPFYLTIQLLTTVPGDDCPGIPVTLDKNETLTLAGNTSLAESQRVGLGLCSSSLTPEIVYKVTPNDNGTLTAIVYPDAAYDVSLYARSSCESQASQLQCAENGFSGDPEIIQLSVSAGVPRWFFVDGYAGSDGPYSIDFNLN